MGLALHGQGQLDMAFERLRKVPASDALLDNLYHLAEDFERKRNFAKAKVVYEHILRHNRQYKDTRSRYKRARAKADSGVLEAGLSTMEQPTASAGPALRVIMPFGKVHGVIAAHTPMGCLMTM